MGIDVHNLTLLWLAQDRGCDFSKVVTIGRQSLQLPDSELVAFLRSIDRADLAADIGAVKGDGYCEALMKTVFGSSRVESVDASDFEQASIIHDMNFPMQHDIQASVVLDFGSLEHIFNVPQAIENMVKACRVGGHVLHALPANNWCGHGFYQFSPELFYNVYSAERGFRDTEVFLIELGNPANWYKVRSPFEIKRRVNVINREKTYVSVITKKATTGLSYIDDPPQQSDYMEKWKAAGRGGGHHAIGGTPTETPKRPSTILKRTGLSNLAKTIRFALRGVRHRLIGYRERLHPARKDMELFRVNEWLSAGSERRRSSDKLRRQA